MTDRRNARLRAVFAIVVALSAALVAGGVLAHGHPPTPLPTATTLTSARVATTRPPLPTAIVPAPTAAPTASVTVGEAAPATAARAVAPPTIPATPARVAWVEVGRWDEAEMILTSPFTAPGPWRLCWTLPAVDGVFQVMVADETLTSWDFKSGEIGATAGAFDMPAGGTYSLMFHNDTPYTALVVAPPPGVPAANIAPPPCGP